ncbi:MAG TPA: hypothetical protein VFO38_03325 [Candidatus Saccharimonadales bacterium]|nr:hypothetical protein [Candidatus Saccharimonadales bacterium]
MDNLPLVMLAVVLIVAVVLFALIGGLNKRRSGLDHEYFKKQWQKIESFKSQGSAGWQLAIFEADKLLDHALKNRGIPGQTMGDRLKNARGSFMNNNAVWEAHKLRNRLAHEQNVPLNAYSVDQALRGFRAGLRDLGAM